MNITIVYGFLGSGKTTFLRSLIPKLSSDERVAVLVNEMGEVGIDGTVLESDEMNVQMLSNGCICCELRGDLLLALIELQKKFHPDRLVIEPTGLAAPKQLDEVFADPEIAKFATVDSMATILDATRYEAAHKVFGSFFPDQIASASLVLINKSDLVDDAAIARARQFVKDLNPDGRIHVTTYCDIDPMLIFEHTGATSSVHPVNGDDDHLVHGLEDSTRGMETLSIVPGPLPRLELEAFLDRLAAGEFGEVVRAKGFVATESGTVRMEYVMGQWDLHDFSGTESRVEFVGKNVRDGEIRQALAVDNG